jgi:ADP-heptose:LPS heptosyltransferase
MLLDAAKQIKNLRQYEFDIAIDFQGLLKSGIIAKLSGAKKRWGASRSDLREPAARVFYTDTAKLPDGSHVITQSLALATAALDLDTSNSPIVFPISTSADDKREADAIASSVGGRFAILNPAGGWVTKLWHAEKFGRLADLLWEQFGIASVVVTGPNETDLATKVAAASRSGKTVCAKPSLKGFYELAGQAEIYVGGDTGPTHLAIAAGAPIVGIFGPTEWWRNGSRNPDDICVERFDIDCRIDCHRRTCSNWICMDIPPETVFEAVKLRLARVGSVETVG